ncbi:MAG: hypothetical protein HC895_09720 [Leptolyngbyaceae cyanobacterium SM1_3_5]|nr:hypothetical protein [Leptolyngbyaceae cyanobacterium SM1_3_5]
MAGALLWAALLGVALGGPAAAAPIPPDAMFFPPASLVEGVYPEQPVSGDGESVPFTLQWTEDDLLANDPEILSATITGLQVLPILVPNPATTEGEYSKAALRAITASNYLQYYHYKPGLDVYDLVSDYSADLTANVLTLSILGPGPYAVRVNADVLVAETLVVEHRSYVYGQYVEDGLFQAGGPVRTMVHRTSKLEDIDALTRLQKALGPLPSSDIYVVSKTNPPDKFEEYANDNLTRDGKNVARAGSPQDVINAICAAAMAKGGPVSVTILGHGNGPAGAGGSGFIRIGTGCIGNYPGCMSPCDFGKALAGKVKSVTIGSCYTGSDKQFLQDIANKSGATCGGYTTTVTASKKTKFLGIFCRGGDFDLGSGGKKVKVAMADCNANEIFDAIEIENGDALDFNKNAVPDECEVLPADQEPMAPKGSVLH